MHADESDSALLVIDGNLNFVAEPDLAAVVPRERGIGLDQPGVSAFLTKARPP